MIDVSKDELVEVILLCTGRRQREDAEVGGHIESGL
jgi:hypothetical protein